MPQNPVSSATFVEDPQSNPPATPGPPPALPSGRTTILPKVLEGPPTQLLHQPMERYATTRMLGEGGMGTVALAQDQDIGRPVAIKTLRPRFRGPGGVARFIDEIHTVGRLEHPNIVPIHDVGVAEDGSYFFVMKYVEGETLEAVIERLRAGDLATHRAWPFERRASVIKEVLFALAFAHARSIIHRDIKPANIMIGTFGEVFLTDWGIAKTMGSADVPVESMPDAPRIGGSTRVGTLIGSPSYMSPEQLRGENDRLDARSDLYSVGLVLFEMMALRHPWPEGTPEEIREAQQKGYQFGNLFAFTHPQQGLPPVEYLYLAQKLLMLDREQRLGSANEVIAAIEALERGEIPVQCAITMTKRMTRESGHFVERHPMWSMVMLATIAVASVAWVGLGLVFIGVL
jgi:serine/threonine-protein kinase